MAHSYVEFAGNSVHMHDAEIIATIAYILHFASMHIDRFPAAEHPYLRVWSDVLEAHFSGAIDLEIDESLAAPESVERFRALMGEVRASLAAEPDFITGDRLNAMIDYGEDFVFQDRPREKMLADFDRLVSVVDTALA